MMTQEQIDFELLHFTADPKARERENEERARVALREWKIEDVHFAGSVVEVGCGPFGGCLPFIGANEKSAVDVLNPAYWRAGFRMPEDILRFPATLSEFATARHEEFQAAICYNLLEHGDLSFKDLADFRTILARGGELYLMESMRTEAQLNMAHNHRLTLEDFALNLEGWGVQTLRVLPADPPMFDYPRICAVLVKL